MTVNSHTAGSDTCQAASASISFTKMAHGFLSILARFGAKAKSGLKAMQMARMLSTLSSMSDYQLAQIGIQRSDIPKYAQTLMADD
jgi:uncharacterized protein YjiS (DUF1127 family)